MQYEYKYKNMNIYIYICLQYIKSLKCKLNIVYQCNKYEKYN